MSFTLFNLEGTRQESGAADSVVGGIAQLGEHLLCKQGVIGSSPIISTTECSKSGQSPVKRVWPEEEERRSERAFGLGRKRRMRSPRRRGPIAQLARARD